MNVNVLNVIDDNAYTGPVTGEEGYQERKLWMSMSWHEHIAYSMSSVSPYQGGWCWYLLPR